MPWNKTASNSEEYRRKSMRRETLAQNIGLRFLPSH